MTKQQIQDLIEKMPFDESEKTTLLADLENNLPITVIMEKVQTLINKKEKNLNEANPEEAKAYAEINTVYESDVEKASGQFDSTMEKIEKEADDVNKEVSKQIDQVRVEELKESLPQ